MPAEFNNTVVSINFPSSQIARLFLAWMSDGGGEQYFYDVAADDTGMYLNFDYEIDDPYGCTVSVSGLVVDDDDPEMHGIFEDETE